MSAPASRAADQPAAGAWGRSLETELRLFYAFRLLATSYLFVPIFMLFQESRGLTFFERLALGGVYSAVVILVEVPTGVFADRLGRRRSMMLGAAAMIVSCGLALRAHSFAAFAVAEALAAMSMALCSGADTAYLYDLLARRGRGAEYARRESAASAMHLLGSAIAFAGGGAAAAIDLTLPYVLTAVVAALALAVAAALEDDRQPARVVVAQVAPGSAALGAASAAPLGAASGSSIPVRALGGWRRDVIAALAMVRSSARLSWLVAYSAVVFTLLRATIYVYQPYLDQRGFGRSEIGLLFAGMYVVAAAIAYRTHALRARFREEQLLWALLAVLAISFLLLAQVHAGPVLLGLLAVQAVASGLFSPLTKPLLHREIPESGRRAAVLSVESMARRAALGVFAPLAGLFGQSHVMVLCGVVGLGGMIVLALVRIPAAAAAPRLAPTAESARSSAPLGHGGAARTGR